ncbi:unnamed protein product, partial [Ixodes persulcatus]
PYYALAHLRLSFIAGEKKAHWFTIARRKSSAGEDVHRRRRKWRGG